MVAALTLDPDSGTMILSTVGSGVALVTANGMLMARWSIEDGVRLHEGRWWWDSRRPGTHSLRFVRPRDAF